MQQVENTVQGALAKAKRGNPRALQKLISEPLMSKGIEVDVERKGALLFIALSSKKCPPRKGSLRYIRQGLQKLEIQGIEAVRLSGYVSGEHNPQWVERLPLHADEPGVLVHQQPSPIPQTAGPLKKILLILGVLVVLVGLIGWLMSTMLNQPSTSDPSSSDPSPANPATLEEGQ